MKDSEGREYDGWCIRRANGRLDPWFYEGTRTEVLNRFHHVRFESRRSTRARLKRWGFKIVKVRLVEVVE